MNSLRPYQDEAADFLYERNRAMILAPVGAGKTAITLTAMQDMLANGVVKRFLVLAPKRVCTDVWPVEQPKWAPHTPLAVAVGTPKQRRAALVSKAQIVVSTMKNKTARADEVIEGLKIDVSKRINQIMTATSADLNQADFFKVTMQAVSLGINRYAVAGCELGNEISEGFFFGDQGSARNFSGSTRSPAWRALGSRT
jgi:superfamily II DNA/RNA helicase